MKDYRIIVSSEEIQDRVRELAQQISNDYAGKNPLLITLLKGAFIFLADLVRHLTIPHEIDFITLSSYRNGLQRSGEVKVINHLRSSTEDRDIIIIDGIVDTGHTLSQLIKILSRSHIRSIRVCALLDKRSTREVDVQVHYTGFTIPDIFVVGYGLDYKEQHRNISYIAELTSNAKSYDESAELNRSEMPMRKNREKRESVIASMGGDPDSTGHRPGYPYMKEPDS